MTRKETQTERRAHILQAAIDCFIVHGFHATSMRDIAQAASVSLGNLYNYFPGKEALIAEVAGLEQLELAPLLAALAQAETPAATRIERFLAAYASLCAQHEWAVLAAECLAEMTRTPALAPAFAANHTRLVTALAGAITQGVAQGAFMPPAPAEQVARILLDAVESEAIRQTLMPSPGAKQAATAAPLHPGLLHCLLGRA